MEAGSPMDRVFLLFLFFISIYFLSRRKFEWSNAIRQNTWPIIIVLYMLVSVIWSGMPGISFRRCVRELVAFAMAFLVMSEEKPLLAAERIFLRTIYIIIPFSIILIKYFPEYGRGYNRWTGGVQWLGMAYQKNGLAMLCAFSIMYLIWKLFKGRDKKEWASTKLGICADILVILMSAYLLGGPDHTLKHSATSSVSLIIGLLVFVGLIWVKKREVRVGRAFLITVITFVIIYGTITPFIGKLAILDISSYLGRDETLTGRADAIWAILVPYALSKPLLGHGFGGFWTTGMREMTSAHAHNGYLDAILDLGVIGLLMLFIYIISCCIRATKLLQDDFWHGALFVCYLIITAVRNITESFVHGFDANLTATLLLLYVATSSKEHEPELNFQQQG
jgi:O-antigen ligase